MRGMGTGPLYSNTYGDSTLAVDVWAVTITLRLSQMPAALIIYAILVLRADTRSNVEVKSSSHDHYTAIR